MSNLSFYPNSLLIDNIHRNKSCYFYDSYEEELFAKTKHEVDKKYLDRDIVYQFNSLGYRTREFSEVSANNFILFFGCSHTEGAGLFEEDIWCSQLCSKLGIDKINLGKGSSGPTIQYLNTLQYVKNGYPKPKLVVYQWPQTHRRSFTYLPDKIVPEFDDEVLTVKHHTVFTKPEKHDSKWYFRRYCVEPGERMLNSYTNYFNCQLLWKSLDVPVFNWTWGGDFNDADNHFFTDDIAVVNTIDTGKARDLMHDGTDVHTQVVDQIKPQIDKLL